MSYFQAKISPNKLNIFQIQKLFRLIFTNNRKSVRPKTDTKKQKLAQQTILI
jgi:hypothetical protein